MDKDRVRKQVQQCGAGGQSGEAARMEHSERASPDSGVDIEDLEHKKQEREALEVGVDPTCDQKVGCELENLGPHCHEEKSALLNPSLEDDKEDPNENLILGDPTYTKKHGNDMKAPHCHEDFQLNIIEKQETGSKKEIFDAEADPTCTEMHGNTKEGPHCHEERADGAATIGIKPNISTAELVERADDPTCRAEDAACGTKSEGPHCHEPLGSQEEIETGDQVC